MIESDNALEDPLQFKDTKKYTDRIKETRKITGEKDALVISMGDIGRLKVTVAVQNFAFMGGSMGMAVGNSFIAGVKNSLAHKTPFVLFAAAGGARMQEGGDQSQSLERRARRTGGSEPEPGGEEESQCGGNWQGGGASR